MVLGTVDDPYISELVTGVHTAASHLQSGMFIRVHAVHQNNTIYAAIDLVLQNHPFILVQPIRTSCRFAELQDGHLIDMDITNELPVVSAYMQDVRTILTLYQVLHVDEIALTGSGRGNRAVRFSTGATTLGLGKSRCSLSCMVCRFYFCIAISSCAPPQFVMFCLVAIVWSLQYRRRRSANREDGRTVAMDQARFNK